MRPSPGHPSRRRLWRQARCRCALLKLARWARPVQSVAHRGAYSQVGGRKDVQFMRLSRMWRSSGALLAGSVAADEIFVDEKLHRWVHRNGDLHPVRLSFEVDAAPKALSGACIRLAKDKSNAWIRFRPSATEDIVASKTLQKQIHDACYRGMCKNAGVLKLPEGEDLFTGEDLGWAEVHRITGAAGRDGQSGCA